MNKCLVCIENEQLRKCYLACLKKAHRLDLENEELKQKVSFYKYFQKDARELSKENERLKREINMLKYTIARNEVYIQRIKHKGEWR